MASAKKLTDAGAKALRGDIEDLNVLREGAAAANGVIHTAFYQVISHLPRGTRLGVFLGGLPTGIVKRFLKAVLEADRRALETMGGVFVGTDRPLVGTFGTLAMKSGSVATEDHPYDPRSAGAQRGGAEATMHQLASHGVRVPPSCACRLSCMVRTTAMALSRYSSRPRGRRRSQPTLVKVTIAGELCTSWTQRACSAGAGERFCRQDARFSFPLHGDAQTIAARLTQTPDRLQLQLGPEAPARLNEGGQKVVPASIDEGGQQMGNLHPFYTFAEREPYRVYFDLDKPRFL